MRNDLFIKRAFIGWAGAVALALALAPTLSHAFFVPANDGFVTDTAGVLTEGQEEKLEEYLQDYQKQTTNEIAILIVQSLGGTAPFDAAVEVGRAWGVGTEENDNGIVMLIAYEDRKMFIATGYGLEGAVPDLVAKGIINYDIKPHFENGDYYEGIFAGVISLEKHIGGEYTAERYDSGGNGAFWSLAPWLFFMFFILANWFMAIMARTKSWWLGGVIGAVFGVILVIIFAWWLTIPILAVLGLLFDYLVSKNYKKRGKTNWWAGGNWGPGGSSGGSSFGGFSGGSFGGGGAGGSW